MWGMGGGGAEAGAPGREPACAFVEFDLAKSSPDWRALAAALRSRLEPQRRFVMGRQVPGAAPFQNVVLKGPEDVNDVRALAAANALARDFAEDGIDFRVISTVAPNAKGRLRAYFGPGVFAPCGDSQVADLQFAFTAAPKAGEIRTPGLDGRRDGVMRQPAGWHAGQGGVCIGFDAAGLGGLAPAPAALDCSGAALDPAVAALLDGAVLFFGRRDAFTPPVVEARWQGPGAQVLTVHPAPDWLERDGEWQPLEIRFHGTGSVHLWLRIAHRNGFARALLPHAARRGVSGPVATVHGLLLPEPSLLGGLFRRSSAARPTSWVVEFDHRLRLRTLEPMDVHCSAVARWGPRLAVYRHREARYQDRRHASDTRLSLELAPNVHAEQSYFPNRHEEGPLKGSRAVKAIYRRNWSMLSLSDLRPFGDLPLPSPAALLGDPVQMAPEDLVAPGPGEDWRFALDWLNRAACVEVAGAAMGLAQYWSRHFKVRLEATPEALRIEVRAVGSGGRRATYEIARGAKGPLGPLYVEYKIL